jgi:hypothetical protein
VNDAFTYWDGAPCEARPAHVDLCAETILKHCSRGLRLHALDRDGVADFLDPASLPDGFDRLKDGELRTAFVRAALLARHGGVWVDPDLVLLKNPEPVLRKAVEHGFAACEREAGVPLTCLMASTGGNEIILDHLERVRKRIADAGRRRIRWPRLFGRSRNWHYSLGRVGPGRAYFPYPAEAFAPVAPKDASLFLDRGAPVETVVGEATTAVSLKGFSALPGADRIERDELLNAGFMVSRIFRRALHIEEEQRHRAYEQVSYHREHSGSWSGPGSTPAATREIVEFLPRVIERYGIRSIGDMPCGDWTWMKEIDLGGVDYTGYDIVEFLIRENRRKHPGVRFEVLDILNGDIGRFDLIICRDFLFHVRTEDAVKALSKFRASGSSYLLSTSFPQMEQNTDLPRGEHYGYRDINLERPPYNLGRALEHVRETHAECHNRVVGLWRLV